MSSAMKAMREAPVLVNFLSSLDNHFLALFVGFVMTAVLQSSSATVGIVLLLASQGLIEVSMTFFMIMGCNIGCTMSAMFAGMGGKNDAKRAALIHFLFNVIGTAILFVVISIFLDPITSKLLAISGGDAGRAVANAHTSIKVIEVIMLFPFMKKIVDLTFKIVPETEETAEEGPEHFETLYIGAGTTRTTAVYDAICEIDRMGRMAIENLQASMELLLNPNEEKIAPILEKEKYIDYLNHAITNFLVNANQMGLPMADADRLGGLFHVVNDIERVGDHAENFADSTKDRLEFSIEFTEKAQRQLADMTEKVVQILNYSLDMFTYRNEEHMEEILKLEDEIDDLEKKLQNSHIKRLTKQKCSPQAGMMFSDTVSGLERVADHATNIAFSIMDPTGDVNWTEDDD
jgi:phosphate:Na+ symporter